jgi:polyhydroxyalkanoate synthase subunit PhaC
MFALMDALRKAQGEALEGLGFGPTEWRYRVLASGPRWRLRDYGGPDAGPPVLIVAAPIKRPYLWDLAPSVSAVRYCLGGGLRVSLLEWRPPSSTNGNAGLAEYADQAIGEAIATVSRETGGGKQPFLVGHSLGGTLAAIAAALGAQSIGGLVLLSAPLCFQPGVSRFRDAIVAMAPSSLSETDVVPGSLLSQLSALASPETFVWSRLLDATLSSADPLAWDIHARVERWALDEVPLPSRLVRQMREPVVPRNPADRPEDRRAVLPAASRPRGRQHGGRHRASGIGHALLRRDAGNGRPRARFSGRGRRGVAPRHPGRPSGLRAGLARDHLMAEGSVLKGGPAAA